VMHPRRRPLPVALPFLPLLLPPLLAVASTGCGSSDPPVSSLYALPDSLVVLSEEHFFDHPWPSDLRLENGSPRFTGYYNPRSKPIIATYIDAMKGVLDGFSPAAAGFLRFSGPIDPTSLPATPDAALHPGASVQLINIDPDSPDHGKRSLVSLEWKATEGVYILPNTLAFIPTIGFPLRPHTRYALVVTDALRAADGRPILAGDDLVAALGNGPAEESRIAKAREALAPAVAEIEAAGVTARHIVHLAVFTTSDPVKELVLVRDDLRENFPPPTVDPAQWYVGFRGTTYTQYIGAYGPSPNYQAGNLPFASYGDGGEFEFMNGAPQVVSTFNLRFSLTVPNMNHCPMPKEGYPIVLYAHGTGGNFESYTRDGTARALAQRCIAAMGVDQIFHGTRPGAPPDGNDATIQLLFFNFENPIAARTNGRQSAIDEVHVGMGSGAHGMAAGALTAADTTALALQRRGEGPGGDRPAGARWPGEEPGVRHGPGCRAGAGHHPLGGCRGLLEDLDGPRLADDLVPGRHRRRPPAASSRADGGVASAEEEAAGGAVGAAPDGPAREAADGAAGEAADGAAGGGSGAAGGGGGTGTGDGGVRAEPVGGAAVALPA